MYYVYLLIDPRNSLPFYVGKGSGSRASQKLKRNALQKERGGYGPKKHSVETRAKITKAGTGRISPHKESTKKKISEANKGKIKWTKYIYHLTDPNGYEYQFVGLTNLRVFCQTHNLSFATFSSAMRFGWSDAKKGKNSGWKLKRLDKEVENEQYVIGNINQDITPDTFKGFTL